MTRTEVRVSERAVGKELVICSGRVAGVRAVAVGVVRIGFGGLTAGVGRPGELAGRVVRIARRAVDGNFLREVVGQVVLPHIGGERRCSLRVRQGGQAAEAIVSKLARGHRVVACRIGIAGDGGELAVGVEAEIDLLGSHRAASGDAGLRRLDHSAGVVSLVIIDEVGRAVNCGLNLDDVPRVVVLRGQQRLAGRWPPCPSAWPPRAPSP